MPRKLPYKEVSSYIESKGDILISNTYENNRKLLAIRCETVNNIYEQTFRRFKLGYKHRNCPKKSKIHYLLKQCVFCNKAFIVQKGKDTQKLCNVSCKKEYMKQKDHYKIIGRLGG